MARCSGCGKNQESLQLSVTDSESTFGDFWRARIRLLLWRERFDSNPEVASTNPILSSPKGWGPLAQLPVTRLGEN
jgi:hypothetical protein